MYWMGFPTSTNVGLLHSDCLLSTSPSTSRQLVPRCSSMYVHYQMLASSRGRQQAELNQSQVGGLWPHLNIQKLPSWQQHRSGVVHFACARPSARSEQDGAGGAPGRACSRRRGGGEFLGAGGHQHGLGFTRQGVFSPTGVIILDFWKNLCSCTIPQAADCF